MMRHISILKLDISNAPGWRKIAAGILLVAACLTGAIPTLKEYTVYRLSPASPVRETGETHRVEVNHGFVRYVTQKEAEDLSFWNFEGGLLIGGPFLLAFLVLTMFRSRRSYTTFNNRD